MNDNSPKRILLNPQRTDLIIKRFALELIENHGDFSQSAIIGLQPRGIELAEAVKNAITDITNKEVKFGTLDHTFYRDDISRGGIHIPKPSKVDFSTENRRIILIDDVLYTGRSIRAAIDAIMRFGRPSDIELMVMVDRIHQREVPIKPDYKGVSIDSRNTNQFVKVEWNSQSEVLVWLLDKKL
jgi:pyrimidine operon attenuation protein / uracil phosphoribosyltransferase